jgi:hypothetical protein
MPWVIGDATDMARHLVQDRVESYRHSDAKLVSYYNHALLEARRLRPDLFIANSGNVTKYTTADIAGNTAFPLDQSYLTAVAHYIAGMVMLEDDEFASDGRAMAVLQLYRSALLGGGS